jgi:hypothetical protein
MKKIIIENSEKDRILSMHLEYKNIQEQISNESEEIYKEGTKVQEFDIYGLPIMKSGNPVIRTCIPDELKKDALMGKADKKYNSHDYVSIDLCKKNYRRFVPINMYK